MKQGKGKLLKDEMKMEGTEEKRGKIVVII
jgi:hypothetical protein